MQVTHKSRTWSIEIKNQMRETQMAREDKEVCENNIQRLLVEVIRQQKSLCINLRIFWLYRSCWSRTSFIICHSLSVAEINRHHLLCLFNLTKLIKWLLNTIFLQESNQVRLPINSPLIQYDCANKTAKLKGSSWTFIESELWTTLW